MLRFQRVFLSDTVNIVLFPRHCSLAFLGCIAENAVADCMLPLISEAYGTDRLQALSAETDPALPHPSGNPMLSVPPHMDFGLFQVEVSFKGPTNPRSDGACLCLRVNENECYLLGNACGLNFVSLEADKPNLDYLLVEEGSFDNGVWKPGRRMNGDETARLFMDHPTILRVRFFRYA